MQEDIESNFWKEHFTHLQHKNMVRIDAQRLDYNGFLHAVEQFSHKYKEYNPSYENNGSYIAWEATVTNTIKIRLFYQYQIKGSLLQQQGNDFVKIADAKFPYNPFPEILEFLKRKNQYETELRAQQKCNLQNNMKIKIAGEFIKAFLSKHFVNEPTVIWTLEPEEKGFSLSLNSKGCERKYHLDFENFVSQIKNLN